MPRFRADGRGSGAECGRVRRDRSKAEHLPVELCNRARVPCDEADSADTDHLRHSSLGHGLSRFFRRTLSQVLLQLKQKLGVLSVDRPTQ